MTRPHRGVRPDQQMIMADKLDTIIHFPPSSISRLIVSPSLSRTSPGWTLFFLTCIHVPLRWLVWWYMYTRQEKDGSDG